MIERGRNFLPLLVLVCYARLADRSAHGCWVCVSPYARTMIVKYEATRL
jgi:hypothetical protein